MSLKDDWPSSGDKVRNQNIVTSIELLDRSTKNLEFLV